MCKHMRLEFAPTSCFLGAALLLLLPFPWIAGIFLAALLHETGHILAIYLLGGRILYIRIGCLGAQIKMFPMDCRKELICALAGPVCGLLAAATVSYFPCFAAAALIQSVWNLVPVYPLDGGRVLRCMLQLLHLDAYTGAIEGLLIFLLLIAAGMISFRWRLNILPVIMVYSLVHSASVRKIPCKRRRMGLQ